MVVQFSILVANNDDLLGLGYTRIEIWQSTDNGNSYHEITASTPAAAFVESLQAQTTFEMGGKLLKFILDGGSELSVDFSTVLRYWTASQVVNRINEVSPGTASLTTGNTVVRLTSPTTGRSSSVQITYNDAADLGFALGITYGMDNRIPITPETLSYLYTDVSGSTSARYEWRFSADGANPFSPFSPYVTATGVPFVDTDKLSICSTTFISLNGQPVKTKVIVVGAGNPSSILGFSVHDAQPLIFESGDDGFIQFTLLRGATVRAAIEGTSFVREFVVPNAASFDLLTVMATAPDPFTVQTVPPFLIRRTI